MKDTVKKETLTQEELDEAVCTLIDASEILNDKAVLKLVKEHAKKREKQWGTVPEINSISDLRKISYKMNEKKSKDE